MDPLVRTQTNQHRSHPYAHRRTLLHDGVLSWAHEEFDEVIVAGTFEKGDNYQYVEVQPRFRDRRDALYQREFGARYTTGNILVFCHDDHAPAEDFGQTLEEQYSGALQEWDLLIPQRKHPLTDEILNNGKDAGYMGGHCLVMKRWLWAEVPWTILDTEYWDIPMTREWKKAGAILNYADDLIHFDLEATTDEN